MAEYTGPNTTANLDAAVQSKIDVTHAGGRLRTYTDARFEATAWAQSDTVLLARLPSSVLLSTISRIVHEAFGTSVTADVGIFNQSGKSDFTDDDDALAVDVDISTAGSFNLFDGIAIDKTADRLWELTDASEDPGVEVDVKLTLKDANPTDDAAIGWSLVYVED